MEWLLGTGASILRRVREMFSAPRRIAALEREIADLKEKQGSVVIHGGVHGGVHIHYRDGQYHAEIEGRATVTSPLPVRIASATAASGPTGGSVGARKLPPSDDPNP